ncbi:MAG: hypothetical protein AAFP28_12620 [Pseudomonadota bacterium]
MLDPFIDAESQYFCGLISATLSLLAFAPYMRDTLRGSTRPFRASWLIWSVLSSISLASQIAEGATMSLFYAGAQCGGTLFIFTLSIWRGMGTFLRGSDAVVLLAALVGLVFWYASDNAAYALFISCGISLLGGSVTVYKAYLDPDSETMSFWAISFVASLFAMASVGRVDAVLMAYPAYLLILKSSIITAMIMGRGVQRRAPLAVA